jgi:hypothetical protein
VDVWQHSSQEDNERQVPLSQATDLEVEDALRRYDAGEPPTLFAPKCAVHARLN